MAASSPFATDYTMPAPRNANAPDIEGSPDATDYPSVTKSRRAPAISSIPYYVGQMHHETTTSTAFVEHELYARMLLLSKRGYPLWKPKARSTQHPELYKRNGVHIGDVGLLSQFGGFDYLFNVCHGADHELNLGRVPKDFRPVSGFDANDVVESTYRPGDYVASDPSRIHQSRVPVGHQGSVNQFEGVPKEFGAGQAFSSTTSKGAILILPEGGKRVDYLKPEIFANYTAENAVSWYTHAQGPMGREARNGSLYLITGFDKARAWGSATFLSANPENVVLKFVPLKPSKGDSSYPRYHFRECHSAVWKSGEDDTYGEQSGSVFLRGYRIAIRKSWFCKMDPGMIKNNDFSDPDRLLRVPTNLVAWLQSVQILVSAWMKQQFSNDVVEFYYIPNTQVYHPLDTINSWLLRKRKADIVLSHDDALLAFIRDDDDEMPDSQELFLRLKKCNPCVEYGTTSRGHRWAIHQKRTTTFIAALKDSIICGAHESKVDQC
ncbi:hypothetical protein FB446DRAFT_771237 [Lentinula raphanica]|nr:hypothetical protein FB446DRAFT_771237 [Lentinula raphanica]